MKKTDTARTIAVFSETPLFDIPIFIIEAVEKICRQHRANMLYICSKAINSPIKHHIQSNILYNLAESSKIDGIIIASNLIATYIENNEYIDFCRRVFQKPAVSLLKTVPGIPGIVTDNMKGVYDITRHLLERHGYRKIVFITGPPDNMDSQMRFAGYKKAMEEAGIPPDELLVLQGNFQVQSGQAAVKELVKDRNKKPGRDFEAIITANDYMALGVLQKLAEYKIGIPEQVAVCGFDDIGLAKHFEPPLTTIRQTFGKIAEKAASLLFGKLDGKPLKEIYRVKCENIYRESCGCPPLDELDTDVTKELGNKPVLSETTVRKKLLPELHRLIFSTNASSNLLYVWAHTLSLLQKPEYWSENTFSVPDRDISEQVWPVLYSTTIRAVQMTNYQQVFSGMKTEMMSTHNEREIMDLLFLYLPRIGISQCYISLYMDQVPFGFPQALPEKSRLVLAFGCNKRINLPEGGLIYPTVEILPDIGGCEDKTSNLIIESLYFQDEQIGICCMDTGLVNKTLYTELNILISNALFGSLLIRREKEKSDALSKANRQIQSLNAKLKDENIRINTEMEVAREIQTHLLPENITDIHPDFRICAKMITADAVGGDYYDVLLDKNSDLWLAIGDVSGHGVTAGLVMMMAQTIHATVTTQHNVTPQDVVAIANRVIYRNLHHRMKTKNYMTFMTLKYLGNGDIEYAGAHLDMLVFRRSTGVCEEIESTGTWLNILEEIDSLTMNRKFHMERGDLLVLYTDGITEAFDNKKDMFGIDGIRSVIIRNHKKHIDEILEKVYEAVLHHTGGIVKDDMTLLIAEKK
ncbi:MAG: SpoIIE family protein phosphatase [Spirochaetales bacterium]|nr:SpoIIE family protein phosphatase [Spirochaetales bacterium]